MQRTTSPTMWRNFKQRSYLVTAICCVHMIVAASGSWIICDHHQMDKAFRCDGQADCWDKRDEIACTYDPCALAEGKTFRCKTGDQCVLSAYRCDGQRDCNDGSDEDGCKPSCPGFICEYDGKCLNSTLLCDGHDDCVDGSDELLCENKRFDADQGCEENFSCGDGTCLTDLDDICDNKPDCKSALDEDTHLCNGRVKCNECEHDCIHHHNVTACRCKRGFRLWWDRKSCSDINECKSYHSCSQQCSNYVGGYKCSCTDDYELVSETSCDSLLDPVYVWYRERTTSSVELLIKTSGHIRKVVARMPFPQRRPIFYFDSVRDEIYISNGTGIFRQHIIANVDDLPSVVVPLHVDVRQFVIDTITRNLYVLHNKNTKLISVCSIDAVCVPLIPVRAADVDMLAISNVDFVWHIVWRENENIISSTLDGSEVRRQYRSRADIRGFTIQDGSSWLYVVHEDTIVEVNLAGDVNGAVSTRIYRTRESLHGPFNVDISWLVYSLEDQLVVQERHERNEGNVEFRVHQYSRMKGFHRSNFTSPPETILLGISVPQTSTWKKNACSKNPCSHVCVSIPNRHGPPHASCLCPPGMVLDRTGTKCSSEKAEEVFYVKETTLMTFAYVDGTLYPHLEFKLKSTPTAITASDKGTFFLARRGHRGLLSIEQTNGKSRLYKSRLRFARSIVFDPVDDIVYAVDGDRRLLAIDVKMDKMAVVMQNTSIEHLDIDPRERVLFTETLGGGLYSLTIGSWKRSSLNHSISHLRNGQKTWAFDMFKREVIYDASVILKNGYCDIVHKVDRPFDCKNHPIELEHCTDVDHDHSRDLLGRSGPPIDTLPLSACNNSNCSLCVTQKEGNASCLCPYGHTMGADGVTCSLQCDKRHYLRCPLSGVCIDKVSLCDAWRDCEDGSDELLCAMVVGCGSESFKCDSGMCIDAHFRCDSQDDCNDGSDEKHCAPYYCKAGQFSCLNGDCIPDRHRCDGVTHCFQGEDEQGCPIDECETGEFRCSNGRCIPLKFECDGGTDCLDASDEANCKNASHDPRRWDRPSFVVAAPKCDPNIYMCCGSGEMLSLNVKCNHYPDCEDGTDEEHCLSGGCGISMFACGDGNCTTIDEMCDGIRHCTNGADEDHCHGECEKKELFECHSSGHCLPYALVCNGKPDCPDGSDESKDNCTQPSSTASPTPTPTLTSACPPDKHNCLDGTCIPMSQVCDKIPQCPDGSDEGDHCLLDECKNGKNGGCSQLCMPDPSGVRCGCFKGFQLMADNIACEDVDECEEGIPKCSHFCKNLKGNYSCSCADGFVLTSKGRCKVERDSPLVLIAEHGVVEVIDASENRVALYESAHESHIGGISYDFNEDYILISETDDNVIRRIATKSNNHRSFKRLLPGVLAVDWLTKNVYFVDHLPFIHVCTDLLGGKHCTQITRTAPQELMVRIDSIALVPDAGIMFYAEKINRTIFRLDMDGANKKPLELLRDSTRRPRSLTVDLILRRLYWLDWSSGSLEHSDFDGQDLKTIVRSLSLVRTFAMFEDRIILPNPELFSWVIVDRLTGTILSSTRSITARATIVQMIHRVQQPLTTNRCYKSPCEQICLLRPDGHTCACTAGFILNPTDNSTCIEAPADYPLDNELPGDCGCANGGRCLPPREIHEVTSSSDSDFYCRCRPGYQGPQCEVSLHKGAWQISLVCGFIVVCIVAVAVVLYHLSPRLRNSLCASCWTLKVANPLSWTGTAIQLVSRRRRQPIDDNCQEMKPQDPTSDRESLILNVEPMDENDEQQPTE